jgi:hypothetical protein
MSTVRLGATDPSGGERDRLSVSARPLTENRNMEAFLRLVADGWSPCDCHDRVLPTRGRGRHGPIVATGPERAPGVVLRLPGDRGHWKPAAPASAGSRRAEVTSGRRRDPRRRPGRGEPSCAAPALSSSRRTCPAMRAAEGSRCAPRSPGLLTSARDTAPARHPESRDQLLRGGAGRRAWAPAGLIGTRHHLHAAQTGSKRSPPVKYVSSRSPLPRGESDRADRRAARRARRLLAVGLNPGRQPASRRRARIAARGGAALALIASTPAPPPPGHWAVDPTRAAADQANAVTSSTCSCISSAAAFRRRGAGAPSDGVWWSRATCSPPPCRSRTGRAVPAYTGLGDPAPRSAQIFRGGMALVLDDFRSLAVHGGAAGGCRRCRSRTRGGGAMGGDRPAPAGLPPI